MKLLFSRFVALIDREVTEGSWGLANLSSFIAAVIMLTVLIAGYLFDEILSALWISAAIAVVLLALQLWRMTLGIRQQWRDERDVLKYMKKYDD